MSVAQTFVSFGREIDPSSRYPKMRMRYPDPLRSSRSVGILYSTHHSQHYAYLQVIEYMKILLLGMILA
jgi:hypothetical protein